MPHVGDWVCLPQKTNAAASLSRKNSAFDSPELELRVLSLGQPARPVDRLLLLHLLLSEGMAPKRCLDFLFAICQAGPFYWQPFPHRSILRW